MSKNAADEGLLGTLHNKVATVMVGILKTTEVALEAYEEVAKTADVEQLAMMNKPELSPAMLSAMTKFLADNKITCNMEESKAGSQLDALLKAKRARKSVGNIVPFHPDDH